MKWGKRILLWVLTPLFSVLLFALAFDYGVIKTLGDVKSVKTILAESGIYQSVLPSVLKQSGTIDTSLGSIAASDPLVQEAATKALPANDIQKNSETAINSLYSWLNGKEAQPTFNLNFSGNSGVFADSLSQEVGQKLSSLPTCTTGYTTAGFDALNATCLPPGVSATAAALAVKNSLSSGKNPLGNISVSATDFKGKDPNKTVFQDQLKNAPSLYQRLKSTPLILAIVTILVGSALVLLRPSLASGFRHMGAALLSVGVAMLIFAWVFNYVLGNRIIPKINANNKIIQGNVTHLVLDLGQKIDHSYWVFGGLYSAGGLVAVTSPLWIRKRPKTENAAPQNTETTKSSKGGDL